MRMQGWFVGGLVGTLALAGCGTTVPSSTGPSHPVSTASAPVKRSTAPHSSLNPAQEYLPNHVQTVSGTGPGAVTETFLSQKLGWKLTPMGSAAGSEGAQLSKTADGGKAWTVVASTNPEGTEGQLPTSGFKTGVSFSSPQSGWLAGSLPEVANQLPTSELFHTTNGGKSWQHVVLPLGQNAGNPGQRLVLSPPTFFNPQDGVLMGYFGHLSALPSPTPMVLWVTDNGGASWHSEPTGIGSGHLAGLSWEIPNPPMVILTVGSHSFETTNVGRTWTPVASPSAVLVKEPVAHDYVMIPAGIVASASSRDWVQVAGSPHGVVLALPPHFPLPNGSLSPSAWSVWVDRPTSSTGVNLLAGAQQVAVLPASVSTLQLRDLTGTGSYAVFWSRGPEAVWALNLSGTKPSFREIGAATSSLVVTGRSAVAYRAANGGVQVDDLKTGQQAGPFTVASSASGIPFWWSNGTVTTAAGPLSIPFLPPYTHTLPSGYQWAKIGQGPASVLAVPHSYQLTQLPGGSSEGVKATDPTNPGYSVTVWRNGCAGCYNPGILAQGLVALANTPYPYGPVPAGETILPHNAVLITHGSSEDLIISLPMDGNIEITITDATAHPNRTREILSTVWYP